MESVTFLLREKDNPTLKTTGNLYFKLPDFIIEKLMFSAETPIHIFLLGKTQRLMSAPPVNIFLSVKVNL